jgi:inhibitor of growth protein 4
MTTAVYLEHYLDSLEALPLELQRNFNLMRDLDTRSQNLLKEIDGLAEDYLNNVRTMNGEMRKEHLANIQKLFSKSKEFGDDKVQLAMQTYEMVDKHIRRLDSDLARFEAELKEKASDANQDRSKEKESKRSKKRDSKEIIEDITSKKKKRKSQVGEENVVPGLGLSSPIALVSNHASDVLDMPVDPNEPTYCLCHQVSYGEMIGCDNNDCPIEWFHFVCVGLTTKPKGKWYCPRCSADKKKKTIS